MQITSRMAEFIHETEFSSLPAHTVDMAKLAFLDWLGVTIAGSRHASSGIIFNALKTFSGKEQATIMGLGERMDVFSASLINGYFSHVLDYDDVHLGMLGHPSVPVFPALLSLAEWQKRSGKEMILAFVLGVDFECRLGEAVNPQHYDRGWHSTSTLGHFGAAVGAAKLLGLETEKIVYAIGIAGTLASGVRQAFGSMCKPLHPGKAAKNGLLAALLCEKGFSGSQEMLGGAKGFTSVLCDRFDPATLTYQLGQKWKVDEIIFKRHAACFRTHAIIDCILALRQRIRPGLEDVVSIHCKVPPIALDHAGIMDPQNGLEGKFSQSFCAAVALVEGKAMDQQFTDDRIKDLAIRKILEKTKVEVSKDLGPAEALVEISLKDGNTYREQTDVEKTQIPEEKIIVDLKEKFQALLSGSITEKKSEALFHSVINLETVTDMGDLVRLCSF